MYFPHKVFIPFLQQVDASVKQVINPASFSKHGSNLIKVRPFTTSTMELVDNRVTFRTKRFWSGQGQIFWCLILFKSRNL